MGAICVSARIADSTLNQTLAVAYRNQIRNGDTRLFAQTGKPKSRGVLTGPPTPWCRRRKWGNQRTAGPKTKQNEGPGLGSIPAIGQTTSWVCTAISTARHSFIVLGFPALNLNLESESGGFSA